MTPASHQFDPGTPGSAVLGALTADMPQVALLIGDVDIPGWVAAFAGGGPELASTQFLLTDGAKGDNLFGSPPLPVALLSRIQGTAPATPSGKAFDVFRANYMGAFPDQGNPGDTAFVANAYDAFYAVALSLAVILPGAPITGAALAQGMTRLSSGAPVDVGALGYAAAYAALAAGQPVDLQGTSGPIDFDPATGDIVSAPIEVWAIDTTNPSTPKFKTLMNVTP
jgi:branched-chain amino acid transport system substrate-binding protein